MTKFSPELVEKMSETFRANLLMERVELLEKMNYALCRDIEHYKAKIEKLEAALEDEKHSAWSEASTLQVRIKELKENRDNWRNKVHRLQTEIQAMIND